MFLKSTDISFAEAAVAAENEEGACVLGKGNKNESECHLGLGFRQLQVMFSASPLFR